MATKVLIAEKRGTDYYIKVHLDDTRTVKDGEGNDTPDPVYVREWTWGKPAAGAEAAYLVSIRAQAKDLAVSELKIINKTTPSATKLTAIEGTIL